MADFISDGAVLSPLAQQLQSLINQGIVTPSDRTDTRPPSAMVVLQVYDASGTGPFKVNERR